jgi:hypothetical protein
MLVVADARSACHSTLPPLEGAISVNATVPLLQRTTKGPDWRAAGVAMPYKLLDAVQARWRRLNGHGLVALVRAAVAIAIKLSSLLARRDIVAPSTAGHDRDGDIVELALAVLDEELGSWVATRYGGRASQAEGVLEPNEQSGDAS